MIKITIFVVVIWCVWALVSLMPAVITELINWRISLRNVDIREKPPPISTFTGKNIQFYVLFEYLFVYFCFLFVSLFVKKRFVTLFFFADSFENHFILKKLIYPICRKLKEVNRLTQKEHIQIFSNSNVTLSNFYSYYYKL